VTTCLQERFKDLWPNYLVTATLISYLFFFGIGGFLHVSALSLSKITITNKTILICRFPVVLAWEKTVM
jgi:hypothetical protein